MSNYVTNVIQLGENDMYLMYLISWYFPGFLASVMCDSIRL